jgi:hypothetical protein
MKHHAHRRPLIVGFLGAALAPALGMVAYGLIAASSDPASADDWMGSGLLFVLTLGFSLVGVVLFALPYVLWARRLGWLSWPTVLVGSAVAGPVFRSGLFGWVGMAFFVEPSAPTDRRVVAWRCPRVTLGRRLLPRSGA